MLLRCLNKVRTLHLIQLSGTPSTTEMCYYCEIIAFHEQTLGQWLK